MFTFIVTCLRHLTENINLCRNDCFDHYWCHSAADSYSNYRRYHLRLQVGHNYYLNCLIQVRVVTINAHKLLVNICSAREDNLNSKHVRSFLE